MLPQYLGKGFYSRGEANTILLDYQILFCYDGMVKLGNDKDAFFHPSSSFFLITKKCVALEEHDGKVSIDGRTITYLWFADDIDTQSEKEQELEALVENLDKTCTRFRMEMSAEKTKLMANRSNGIQREIKVK